MKNIINLSLSPKKDLWIQAPFSPELHVCEEINLIKYFCVLFSSNSGISDQIDVLQLFLITI